MVVVYLEVVEALDVAATALLEAVIEVDFEDVVGAVTHRIEECRYRRPRGRSARKQAVAQTPWTDCFHRLKPGVQDIASILRYWVGKASPLVSTAEGNEHSISSVPILL